MPSDSQWALESLTIRSFRGVADEQTYRFDGKPSLLHGNNGVGKSTAAQCLQWTLYGRFPAEVLQNTAFNAFMVPVGTSGAKWYGRVTLADGGRRMIVTRGQKPKVFTVEVDGVTYEGAEAEEKRDRILGLDMSGFVRTVLLQQSRIRGLLLDSPKDRNAALDRLLGMDDIENILSRLKPRDFTKAAEARREKIQRAQQAHEANERLLVEQRDRAQQEAREQKFLSMDLNIVGLRKVYIGLSARLAELAAKYDVDIEPLPECASVADAKSLSAQVAEALSRIRSNSKLQIRLTDVSGRISTYQSLKTEFERVLATLTELREQQDALLKAHGKPGAIEEWRKQAEEDIAAARDALRSADELRQLLADARQYLEHSPSEDCPVCEQPVDSAASLIADLSTRLDAMTSEESASLEARVTEIEDRIEAFSAALKDIAVVHESLAQAQNSADETRGRIVEALGGTGIPEGKVVSKLEEAAGTAEKEREDLSAGTAAVEKELTEVQAEDRRIQIGLVPVIKCRAELARLEDDWAKVQKAHAADEAVAAELDSIADQFTVLREVLLEAKNEIASETLTGASPGADKLYKKLVRHRIFDSLKITTAPKASKIDYSFEVSASGDKQSAREARLVLSDGQVTATAIGLFFALSDADTHNVDFLYVDDPTQNLDLPCKEAMAKVVSEIGRKRQVIVSTQDDDFVSFLEAEGFFDSAIVHHLERWDGDPVVNTRLAQ